MTSSFTNTYRNVYGGPCLACGQEGYLLMDDGDYGMNEVRTVTHARPDESGETMLSVCAVPMSAGWIKVSPEGTWEFRPHE